MRTFLNDDETAHEHVTEHMEQLGERLLHDGDFPFERFVLAAAKHVSRSPNSAVVAQGDWMRVSRSEVVLVLILRAWREQENVPLLMSVIDSKGNHEHLHTETIGPSEDMRSAFDLAIIRDDLQRPRMFLRWVDGTAQVADST